MKNKKELLPQIAYYSFYLAVVIEVLIVLVDKSNLINPFEGRLFQLTFLLCLVKVCLTKYTKREYAVMALFCLLGAVSYFVTGRNEIIRFVIFIAACKNIDMKRCLKLVFYLTLTGCAVIMLLSVSGIYGTMLLMQEYGRGMEEARYVLGMGHPNALQCMILVLTTLYLYLYGIRMKWHQCLALLGINLFFYKLTDSNTGMLVAVFAIFYTGIFRFVRNDSFRKVCAGGGILAAAGSIVLSVVAAANAYRIYNYVWHFEWSKTTQFFVRLDSLLTGRIHSLIGTECFEGTLQTWSLFSRARNNYYFDMGWVRLFYWYGIIPACIFIISLVVLMIYCIEQKDYMAFCMITVFAVYSVVEAHVVSVYLARNYVLFLFGMYWYRIIEEVQNAGDHDNIDAYV